MRLLLVFLALWGCRKKTPDLPAGSEAPSGSGPGAVEKRPEVVGPIHWYDKTGLCLDVPAGWSGAGRGSDGTLLTLEQEGTEVRFGIFSAGTPPDRRDLVRVFADTGSYRDIPAIGTTGIESWESDVPGGSSLQVWTGEVRGNPVRFEARYPFGNSFTGMTAVEGLLRAVCVE